jgi:hypothetical protein
MMPDVRFVENDLNISTHSERLLHVHSEQISSRPKAAVSSCYLHIKLNYVVVPFSKISQVARSSFPRFALLRLSVLQAAFLFYSH